MSPFVHVAWSVTPPAPADVTIGNTVFSEDSTAQTPQLVTLPSSVTGKLVLIIMRSGRSPSVWYEPAGWSTLLATGATGNLSVFYRVCDGSEGATVSVAAHDGSDNPQNVRLVAIAHRIDGAATSEGTFLAGAYVTLTKNPPNLTPAWGSAQNLWLAVYSARYADWAVTDLPGNYAPAGNIMQASSPSSSYSSGLVAGQRTLTATSENPDEFTVDEGDSGFTGERALTIAVRPAA